MDLKKVKLVKNVSVEMRKGLKLLDKRKVTLEAIENSIVKKLGAKKAILARHTLIEGETFKFKLNDFSFTVKPLHAA